MSEIAFELNGFPNESIFISVIPRVVANIFYLFFSLVLQL